MALVVKNLPASAGDTGDMGSVPESERFLGVENGNLLQYSCLENFLYRGAWPSTICGVTKSQTQLSIHAQLFEVMSFLWLCNQLDIPSDVFVFFLLSLEELLFSLFSLNLCFNYRKVQ